MQIAGDHEDYFFLKFFSSEILSRLVWNIFVTSHKRKKEMRYTIEYQFAVPCQYYANHYIWCNGQSLTNDFAVTNEDAIKIIASKMITKGDSKEFPEGYKLGAWRMKVNLGVSDVSHHANFDVKHLIWKNK